MRTGPGGQAAGGAMAAIEQRRVMSRAEARTRRPVRFPATISPLGWVSAWVGVVRLAITLQPLLSPGALDAQRWSDDARFLIGALGEGAVMGLPAAVALGFPSARRRNRWLFRGAVLLALNPLAGMAVRWLQLRVAEIADPFVESVFDPATPLGLSLALLSLSTALIAIAGAWSLSDGLDEAGARPRRGGLPAAAVAGVAVVAAMSLPYFTFDETRLVSADFALDMAGIGTSAIVIAL